MYHSEQHQSTKGPNWSYHSAQYHYYKEELELLMKLPSQSYEVSLAIRDHTVLPSTRNK